MPAVLDRVLGDRSRWPESIWQSEDGVPSAAFPSLVSDTERWVFVPPGELLWFALDRSERERAWSLAEGRSQVALSKALWLANGTLVTARQVDARWVIERWTLDRPIEDPAAQWRSVVVLELDEGVPTLGPRSWDARFALVCAGDRAWVIDASSDAPLGVIAVDSSVERSPRLWIVAADSVHLLTSRERLRYSHHGALLDRVALGWTSEATAVVPLSERYAMLFATHPEPGAPDIFAHALFDSNTGAMSDPWVDAYSRWWMRDGLLYSYPNVGETGVDVIDPASGNVVRTLDRYVHRVEGSGAMQTVIDVTPDGWTRRESHTLDEIERSVGTTAPKSLCLSRDNQLVAVSDWRVLRVFSLTTGAQLLEHSAREQEVPLVWLENGALLVARGYHSDSCVAELVFEDGVVRERAVHSLGDRYVYTVSKRGSLVVVERRTAQDNCFVYVRDALGGFERRVLGRFDALSRMDFSEADEASDVLATLDAFSLETWTRTTVMRAGERVFRRMSPRRIERGSFVCGGAVCVERLATGETRWIALRADDSATPLSVDLGQSVAIVGSRVGVFAVIAADRRSVSVLDFDGRLRAKIAFGHVTVTTIELTDDGSRLLVATSDCVVGVYRIDAIEPR